MSVWLCMEIYFLLKWFLTFIVLFMKADNGFILLVSYFYFTVFLFTIDYCRNSLT